MQRHIFDDGGIDMSGTQYLKIVAEHRPDGNIMPLKNNMIIGDGKDGYCILKVCGLKERNIHK